MKLKTFALILGLLLVFGAVSGVSMAWLMDNTDAVINTFTAGDVDITLTESSVSNSDSLKMVPGHTIKKDTTLTVLSGSEDCYVFVKIEKSLNFDEFMEFETAADWIALPGNSGVYYQVITDIVTDHPIAVIENDAVLVKAEVTKGMLNALTTDTYPQLTVTGYACQYYKDGSTGFTAQEAWAALNPGTTTP